MKLAAVVLMAGFLAAGFQDQRSSVFRASTHAVAVDVAVFDGDRVVSSLGPADFEVYDNGIRQTITAVDYNVLPIDLRLVFDTSGSISPADLEKYKRAMSRVTAALHKDDHCKILTFSGAIAVAAERQSPPIAISVQRIVPDGTSFFDAVSLAMVTVPALDRRQITIVLSDAADNASFFDEAALVDAARRTDAVVYTIVPPNRGENWPFVGRLQALSLVTGGRVIRAERDTQMGDLLIDALEEFRHSYVVRYLVAGAAPEGWHTLRVKVRGGDGYTIRARQGYFGNSGAAKGRLR